MKSLMIENPTKILKNKKKLEKALNVKIANKGKETAIDGNAQNEYTAEQVINALNFGFKFSEALSIKKENKIFEIINIKEHTHKKSLKKVRARIIGKEGKTLKTLENLTNSYIEVRENKVGVICDIEQTESITNAIIFLSQGAKHGNVYSFLEKNQPKPIYDLGLKDKNLKKL